MDTNIDRRRNAMTELTDAMELLISACKHPDTGNGRRVRDLIWSLYGDAHQINLCDTLSYLDLRMGEAVLAAIRARFILGGDCEDILRSILLESGEMARWNEAEARTPEGCQIVYPPRRYR